MKITFVGIACFLIEDNCGGRLLIDVYKDVPEHAFGLTVPQNLVADIVLSSHPESGHSNMDDRLANTKYPKHESHSEEIEIFPNLNLRGTLVKEWNGDLCVAFHFTIDGMRCLHLTDNCHPLSKKQLDEIGKVDVLFISMPKAKVSSIQTELEIINNCKPKVIIPMHIIPLPQSDIRKGLSHIEEKLGSIILPNVHNEHATMDTVEAFSQMLLSVNRLGNEFSQINISETTFELNKLPDSQTVYYFEKCLGF